MVCETTSENRHVQVPPACELAQASQPEDERQVSPPALDSLEAEHSHLNDLNCLQAYQGVQLRPEQPLSPAQPK